MTRRVPRSRMPVLVTDSSSLIRLRASRAGLCSGLALYMIGARQTSSDSRDGCLQNGIVGSSGVDLLKCRGLGCCVHRDEVNAFLCQLLSPTGDGGSFAVRMSRHIVRWVVFARTMNDGKIIRLETYAPPFYASRKLASGVIEGCFQWLVIRY